MPFSLQQPKQFIPTPLSYEDQDPALPDRPDISNHWARSFIPMKATFPQPTKGSMENTAPPKPSGHKFTSFLPFKTSISSVLGRENQPTEFAPQPNQYQGLNPADHSPVKEEAPEHVIPSVHGFAPRTPVMPNPVILKQNGPKQNGPQQISDGGRISMSIDPSLRTYLRKSYLALAILVIGIGGWAALSSIKSAVIAQGTITVEGKPESVQHLDGGRISAIHVQDGQFVNQGDVILELDRIILDASQLSAETSYFENQALIARLLTEKSGQALIDWPLDILAKQTDPSIRRAMSGQQSLLVAKQTALNGQIQQISQQISQFDGSIANLSQRIDIIGTELSIVEQDLPRLQHLLSQRLIPKDRVSILERDQARLTRERATILAERDAVTNSIHNARLEIEQIIKSNHEAVLTELRAAQTQAAPLIEHLKTMSQKQSHIDVVASASGIVHNLHLTTLGGIIAPGQEILQIIPQNSRLLVNIKVRPQDIDQISEGQTTRILFSSLNQKITPELNGTIVFISPNSIQDEITGEYYYQAHVQFSQSEKEKLGDITLIPGMQAETYIQTGSRSVLSYLTKPVKDAMAKAMRET